ncbi:tetratricopeptide repeat protein [Rhizobium laguerreae]|uniref:Tfp pilus assembly protein PilF n=1 Tax=Rhizobium laguerreae TaxID=1076926 RepID=A0ABR6G7J6_9HYPH|nr:tetratricopeptide repeat protein [Rhizobium laguerreae]MBB3162236.1 Tfp pilus assembly protein PilF [Rhizobium laguerreae]
MASYQRIALFVFFDSIEQDLVLRLRSILQAKDSILTPDEREKTLGRLKENDLAREGLTDFDLLHRLDIGDKYSVLLRSKALLSDAERKHYQSKHSAFISCIAVRNAVMHGRPLTIEEYSRSFALASDLIKSPSYWPSLSAAFNKYNRDPHSIGNLAISFIETADSAEVFHNLPVPDYDDTGFFPRPQLEAELKKKILSRHPVVTVLGDGGNGKTAITLQTLYGLINSNDHPFDAIVWVSAKSSRLTVGEIERIENAITTSLALFSEVASVFEPGAANPLERVRLLLENNKILLAIDNLETVLDESITSFATDVPGESKVVFTSRIPLGADLTMHVGAFSDSEALSYLRSLLNTYGIESLKGHSNEELKHFASRLGNKPLLIKWFCLGVMAGLSPHSIVKNPEIALRFCMENIYEALSPNAQRVLSIMATLPRAASQAVVQHVASLEATTIEAGIAELLQYSLIERTTENMHETSYQIRPFARSYIIRVLDLSPQDSNSIISKYKSVSSTFQSEQGAAHRDRYSIRSFTVRSPSEALAVQKLRKAAVLAKERFFEEAITLLEDAKISNPEYFEVYRAEAFVYFRQSDFARAKLSYEAAVELAGDQPQIFYFFGGFLLRAYDDFDGAQEAFGRALELDPSSNEIQRELARTNIYAHRFEQAHKLLAEAQERGVRNSREATILTDLRIQAYTRNLEYLLARSLHPEVASIVCEYNAFMRTVKRETLDPTMIGHLFSSLATIRKIERTVDKAEASALADSISALLPALDGQGSVGRLKENGRKPTFGFLADPFGTETYVARSAVGDVLWEAMCEGNPVRYQVTRRADGKTQAENIVLSD